MQDIGGGDMNIFIHRLLSNNQLTDIVRGMAVQCTQWLDKGGSQDC